MRILKTSLLYFAAVFGIGFALGGTPIGAPIVGAIADHWGPRWALGVGALAGFASALIGVGAFLRGNVSNRPNLDQQ